MSRYQALRFGEAGTQSICLVPWYLVAWWRERKVAGWRYCKVVVETWAQNHD
jgi:hypothetical protein